ncbi:MAG: excinuclease ABC subunit UvrC [Erysipelotrichaceae bacterium]
MDKLKNKLKLLPKQPGCYLMKNSRNEVIYVGKAKNLFNRVNSYFIGAHDFKTTRLVQNIVDFDYFITLNEKESLLLEFNLIKKYNPQFNIIFKDDKTYPYIKISNEKFPTVSVVREKKNKDKKAIYFGPYPESSSARTIVKRINEIFPLKKCRTLPKKVCLYYHLNQCLGMCEFPVSNDEYQKLVAEVKNLLANGSKEFLSLLEEKMIKASSNADYESASKYRDDINSLKHVLEKQSVVGAKLANVDIINYFADKGFIAIETLLIRNQQLFESYVKVFEHYNSVDEDFNSYLNQYLQKRDDDTLIVIPNNIEIFEHPQVVSYKKSKYDNLLLMAANNAQAAMVQKLDSFKDNTNAYLTLSELINHSTDRIEVFDNSHISGSLNVSAMIVANYGKLSKKDYRTYKLQENLSDVDSFKEVLYRRYHKALMNSDFNPCDLLIVDGGLQQLNVAIDIRDSLNLDFKIIALAKNKHHKTDRVILEDGSILSLNQQKDVFHFLTLLQDEVHRFAIKYHRLLRKKQMSFSILDNCPNIGGNRKKKLLEHFKNVDNLRNADLKDIQAVIGYKIGLNVYQYLNDI